MNIMSGASVHDGLFEVWIVAVVVVVVVAVVVLVCKCFFVCSSRSSRT